MWSWLAFIKQPIVLALSAGPKLLQPECSPSEFPVTLSLCRVCMDVFWRLKSLLLFIRYWVLAGPIYLCVAFLFAAVLYVAYNFTITLPVDSINTITGLQNKIQGFFHKELSLQRRERGNEFFAYPFYLQILGEQNLLHGHFTSVYC